MMALSFCEQLTDLGALPAPCDLASQPVPLRMHSLVARPSNLLCLSLPRLSRLKVRLLYCLLPPSSRPALPCRRKCKPSLLCHRCLLAPSASVPSLLGLPGALMPLPRSPAMHLPLHLCPAMHRAITCCFPWLLKHALWCMCSIGSLAGSKFFVPPSRP